MHVLTRHLTYFALVRDDERADRAARPRRRVGDDGLTLRWIPGTDSSGQIGNVLLLRQRRALRRVRPDRVRGQARRLRAPATRAASRSCRRTRPATERPDGPAPGVPVLGGQVAARRRARRWAPPASRSATSAKPWSDGARGNRGRAGEHPLALATSAVDLVVSRGTTAPQTRLVLSVAGAKRIALEEEDDDGRPDQGLEAGAGDGDAPQREEPPPPHLEAARQGRRERGQAAPARRRSAPGSYRLTWVARAGTETVRRTIRFTLVAGR